MADKKDPNDPFGIQAWLEAMRDESPERHLALHAALTHAAKEMRSATAPAIFQTFGAQLEEHLAHARPDADLAAQIEPLFKALFAADPEDLKAIAATAARRETS